MGTEFQSGNVKSSRDGGWGGLYHDGNAGNAAELPT